MVGCSVVWCGVVWCGVVWCGGDVMLTVLISNHIISRILFSLFILVSHLFNLNYSQT